MYSTYALCGERCSGTNWIENLIQKNFEIVHGEYPGFKHWPNFKSIRPNNHINIFITRNALDWLKSFFANAHHVEHRAAGLIQFMYEKPFKSLTDRQNILEDDINIVTNKFYEDLWDLRRNKHLDWMKKESEYVMYGNIMKTDTIIKNMWVKYEDVLANPMQFVNFLQKIGFKPKPTAKSIDVVIQYKYYKNRTLNQEEHKSKQFYSDMGMAANWLIKNLPKAEIIFLLQNLITCEFERKMEYDSFYSSVLTEVKKL